MENFYLFFLISLIFSIQKISQARDTITPTEFLRDGQTIISSGGSFEMGFFSPPNSSNNYIGIWYKQIPVKTVVWVANRGTPVSNASSVVLKIVKPCWLALVTDENVTIWSTESSRSVQNPVAKLLDSGNLVVRDANDDNPNNFLWESFNYPTDTVLPGMKIGKNFVTGLEVYTSAWKNKGDPAPGEYTGHCDPTGYPQLTMKNSTTEIYNSGPWNGVRWSGMPGLVPENPVYTYRFVFNREEVYASFDLVNKTAMLYRLVISGNGDLQSLVWVDQSKNWANRKSAPLDACDTYGLCSANSICNIGNSPICKCLDKFFPNNGGSDNDWSKGCSRKIPLDCHNGSDRFLKYSDIKLPDTKQSWFNETMSLQECEQVCLRNCSCSAYSSLNISTEGTGCLLWYGDLMGIRVLPLRGQEIYIRIAASDLDVLLGKDRPGSYSSSKKKKHKKTEILTASLLLVFAFVLFSLILMLYIRKRKELKCKKDVELPLFELSTITRATNNFSANNKIGEGGFGPVYKGVLEGGQEIAVKRLSKASMQGFNEFKNEVIYIAKLQHRNLVKLLGCCIRGEENMLIYEYMPNKSLDSFIFDQTKRALLDWPKRFNIINGIARGVMYLHQDSRIRVIHRDIKASNILLDVDINPKISDFGLARSIGANEIGANTSRVVGTHGYMSPEYTVDGSFSIKSDVFSYGVCVLEIISGNRNRGFTHQHHDLNLLGHAWKLYVEGRSLELVDEHLAEPCYFSELERSIHVGLLCVQQFPNDRPSMPAVVQMLTSDSELPQPKEPGFFLERRIVDAGYSSSAQTGSIYEIPFTLSGPR